MLGTLRAASSSSVPCSISFAGKNNSTAKYILSWCHALLGFALLNFCLGHLSQDSHELGVIQVQ